MLPWTDPTWVRWQVEHQRTGDPAAYFAWVVEKFGRVFRHDILPAMRAFNRAMISTAEATRKFNAVYAKVNEGNPDE